MVQIVEEAFEEELDGGLCVRVLCAELSVRAGPGKEYQKVDSLKAGQVVAVKDILSQEIWLNIGNERYIAFIYRGERLAEVVR